MGLQNTLRTTQRQNGWEEVLVGCPKMKMQESGDEKVKRVTNYITNWAFKFQNK